MDQSWSIERLMSQKTVNPEYYDAAAAMAHPRRFPSPVNDPDWLLSVASWFTEGRTCLELGPGRGEFAKAALLSRGRMKNVDRNGAKVLFYRILKSYYPGKMDVTAKPI